MGKKLDKKYVEDFFKNKGYNLLEDYKNSSKSMLCEKDGYKGFISYSNLKSNKKPGFFKFSNVYFKDNCINFIKNKNKNLIVLDIKKFGKKSHQKIVLKIKCECGNIYKKNWSDIQQGKYAECYNCCIKKRGISQRKNKTEMLNFFSEKGYKVINPKDDFLTMDKIEVENEDGYRGYISYNKLKQGHNISIFDIRINKNNYIYNVNIFAKLRNINVQAIDFSKQNKWTRQGIVFKCVCGNIFETSISSFKCGKFRCDMCSKSISKYENKILDFLNFNKINFIKEYSIYECRDILPLPFDFYLTDYKKIIEVDGEGHFNTINFNNISQEDAEKAFDTTKKHDDIKNKYCQNNNIPILRIPYWEIKDETYKKKILQFIKD